MQQTQSHCMQCTQSRIRSLTQAHGVAALGGGGSVGHLVTGGHVCHEQGNTSVVPKSHRFLNRPEEYAGGNWRQAAAAAGGQQKRDQHDMPGHMQFVGQAGDAMIFDIRCYRAPPCRLQ